MKLSMRSMIGSTIKPYLYSISSALLLSLAFFSPHYACWLVFIFLVPLIYGTTCSTQYAGIMVGYVWGLVFFSVHFSAVTEGVIRNGYTWLRFVAPVVLIGYCACYAALWLCITHIMVGRNRTSSIYIHSVWLITTLGYFYFLRHYLFWPLEWNAGYCFALPLVPLAEYPESLLLLRFVPEELLLMWLLVLNGVLAYVLIFKKLHIIYLIPLLFTPFYYGFFMQYQDEFPDYLKTIAYIAPPAERLYPLETAQEITYRLQDLYAQRPDVACVLMPESSYPFALNEHQEAIDMWFDHALPECGSIMLGAHQVIEKKVYNSAFLIKERRITRTYNKVNLMPYTEKINYKQGDCYKGFNTLFNSMESNSLFSRGKDMELIPFIINENTLLYPLICSDLLWKTVDINRKTIVWLTNDNWFFFPYFKHLFFLWARYQAIIRQSPILYISHTRGAFITLNGKVLAL